MSPYIPPTLASLLIQALASPTNHSLPQNFKVPEFVPTPAGHDYQLCTQGCLPAALLCAAPVVTPPHANTCGSVSFTSPLLEWYTHRDFGAITFGCHETIGQPGCWSCCIDIRPLL
ncbi:hypothetical protein N7452_005270 [Penicillium brevicompactum]|uniref:Uncharacterized protein n=1 Tax=Penicillium brevicompactum TaxID=5074 RepID=A0A9W9UEZ2_PENBR|nr:hypothetical protein N7452_005270 [Penicillium brevicompactum]